MHLHWKFGTDGGRARQTYHSFPPRDFTFPRSAGADTLRRMIDPDAPVALREITRETVRRICRLEVAPEQTRFVASVAVSIAEAHYSPEAWCRAIYRGEEPVGFVMLSLKPEVPEYFLWRFLVDARHQRGGTGTAALRLVIEHVRSLGAKELFLSCVPGDGSPQAFYEKHGFAPDGRMEDDEIVMRLPL